MRQRGVSFPFLTVSRLLDKSGLLAGDHALPSHDLSHLLGVNVAYYWLVLDRPRQLLK